MGYFERAETLAATVTANYPQLSVDVARHILGDDAAGVGLGALDWEVEEPDLVAAVVALVPTTPKAVTVLRKAVALLAKKVETDRTGGRRMMCLIRP